MTAKYLTQDRRLTFEIQGDSSKALFTEIAAIQEIFDCEHKCRVCEGTDIRYVVREPDENKHYELHCQNKSCLARFTFGTAKKGGGIHLYPKRKDKVGPEGKYLPNGGWVRRNEQQDREPSTSPDQDPWS